MRNFFAEIDTPGGHMMVCLAILCVGAALDAAMVAVGHDMIIGATGALFAAMKGRNGSSFHKSPHHPRKRRSS